ncbi:MAG: ABC transporter permease [bacterium]|nr:ABC transporter permease [bacterium]
MILAKTLLDRRRALIGYSLGLSLLILWVGALFPVLRDNEGFADIMERVPREMFAAFGMDLETFLTAAGFVFAEFFALFAPLFILLFVISAVTGEIVAEERDGLMDMMLSNPVSRRRVFVEKAAGVASGSFLTVTAITASLLIANPAFGLNLQVGGVLATGLSLFLLGSTFGGVALLVGTLTGRPAAAGGIAGMTAFLSWFATGFSNLFTWLEGVAAFSPFTWYQEPNPLTAGFGVGHFWLALSTLVLVATATMLFDRRDIAIERQVLPDVGSLLRGRTARISRPRTAWLLSTPFGKTLWDRRRTIWVWSGGLGLLALAMFSAWPTMARDADALAGLITAMPREAFAVFGITNPEALVTPAGFISSRTYQSIGPIVVIIFCVRGVSTALVGQEKSGTLDLVLSNPSSRRRVIASKLAGVGLSAGLVVLVPTAVALLGDRPWETELGVGPILAAGAGLFLLGNFFAALALLLWAVKASLPVVPIAGFVAFATFMMNGLGALADGLQPVRLLSPFYWYFGDTPPLAKGFEPSYFLLLTGTALMVTLAVSRFGRRDIGI